MTRAVMGVNGSGPARSSIGLKASPQRRNGLAGEQARCLTRLTRWMTHPRPESEHASAARQPRTVGAIVSIPLARRRPVHLRSAPARAASRVLRCLGSDAQCEPADLLPDDVILTIWVMNSAISSGRWMKIGNLRLSDEEESSAPSVLKNGRTDRIAHHLFGSRYHVPTERPATVEECSSLETAAVWSTKHVEDRLRDHFAGRPNKWVLSLRVT